MSRHTPLAEWDSRRQRKTQRKDYAGVRSGKLVGREPVAVNRFRNVMWLCDCDCGGTSIVIGAQLPRGVITSCGCAVDRSMAKARESRWKRTA